MGAKQTGRQRGIVRFEVLRATWLASFESPNTRDAYARDLAMFAAWCGATSGGAPGDGSGGPGCSPLAATPEMLVAYRDRCAADGARPATVARRLAALSSFYGHAVRRGALRSNPVRELLRPVRTPAPARVLDDAESDALWTAAAAIDTRTSVLVALLLVDGMRLGEALALDVGEPVAVDGRTQRAIRRHVGRREGGPLLTGDSPTRPGGARLTRFGADFLLKRAAAEAGLAPPISASTLRRTYVVRAGGSSPSSPGRTRRG